MHNLLHAKQSASNDCRCLSRTLKVNGMLALLGLQIFFSDLFST